MGVLDQLGLLETSDILNYKFSKYNNYIFWYKIVDANLNADYQIITKVKIER